MNELFRFIVHNSKWFIFILLITLSCALLLHDNPYRQHVYITSAGKITSRVYRSANALGSYFGLREINSDLNARNAALQAEVETLKARLRTYTLDEYTDTLVPDSSVAPYTFIVANVINNSISRPFNYITIDRGEADGVTPELGVIDGNGVVGIVSNTGTHSARVISLLNPNFRLSCKLKSTDYFGSLVWDGQVPEEALLEELPRHTIFHPGDTVVTSGYSAVFPAGLPVGIVMNNQSDRTQNFFTLRIRLLADFTTLGNVQVVRNNHAAEIRALSEGEEENDNRRNPFGQ